MWDMEQHFTATHLPEGNQVSITSMCLSGDAKLWWHTRVEDTTQSKIVGWETLKAEPRDQFLPMNVAWQAREQLRKLKNMGTVQEYVNQFFSLLLDVKNMSKDDKLFNFMFGLQACAQAKLRRQGVNDLPSAIVAADVLVDFKFSKSAPFEAGSSSKVKKQK